MNTSFRLRAAGSTRVLSAAVMVALLCTEPGVSRTHSVHHLEFRGDSDYVSALATANRFLFAWQTHDEEAGLLLLTEAAKKRSSEEKIADFFTAGPLVTYEIGRGRKMQPGLYVFPLALYTSRDRDRDQLHPRYSRVQVVKTGKEDWGIDTLP